MSEHELPLCVKRGYCMAFCPDCGDEIGHRQQESEGVVVEICGPGEAMCAMIPLRYPLTAPTTLRGTYRLTRIPDAEKPEIA